MTTQTTFLRQLPTILIDIVVPYACYLVLKKAGLSDSNALAWTAIFPGVKVAFDLIRNRRIDVVGCVVIWEVCLTLTLNAMFHSARLILLKGPVQVAALGIACLVSLAFRLPLAAVLARLFTHRALSLGDARVDDLHDADPDRLRTVTFAWALVSLVDAVVRTVLIFSLSTAVYLIVSRVVQTVYFTGMALWTFGYLRRE